MLHPLAFLVGQVVWLLPAFAIALPLAWPRSAEAEPAIDRFDRRIVALLTFAPCALLLAGSVISGRGLITMWGYPFWLFLGLWLVIAFSPAVSALRLRRIALTWVAVAALYAIAFIAQYAVLPFYDHRYRASVFPGDRLGAEIATRFRAVTGTPLAYVVGSMSLARAISRGAFLKARFAVNPIQ